MMKQFLATASLAVVLLFSTETGIVNAQTSNMGTITAAGECPYPKAEEYIKKNKPDLALDTAEKQKRFHVLYFGKAPKNTYENVLFYPTKGGNPIVEVVMINGGCIRGVGNIHKRKYQTVKERFLGKVS